MIRSKVGKANCRSAFAITYTPAGKLALAYYLPWSDWLQGASGVLLGFPCLGITCAAGLLP